MVLHVCKPLLSALQLADETIALFGSELEQRAEYERSNIPGVVMRCIQEVDARGMLTIRIFKLSWQRTDNNFQALTSKASTASPVAAAKFKLSKKASNVAMTMTFLIQILTLMP